MRHLLIINNEGNLMLADVDNDIRMPIGAPLTAEQQSMVTTAAWSMAGQWTAWSVDSNSLDGLRQVRLHDEDTDTATVLVESVSAFYLYPSPCGQLLSHLSPGPLGLELAVSDIVSGEVHVVDRGQPMFWSWSPDATQLAVHVENRVVVADRAGNITRVLTEDAGSFVAPWWLPGGSVLYAVDDCIVAAGPDGAVTTLVEQGSAGRFALDPDGRRLAYIGADVDADDAVGESGGARRPNAALMILDLASLTRTKVTTVPVAAFFWAPDSSRLAVLGLPEDALPEARHMQWLVTDGYDTQHLERFRPNRGWLRTVLAFFEQYAQSHAVWSSDATALVAPALNSDGESCAVIHTVPSERGAEPTSKWIPDAALAWWA